MTTIPLYDAVIADENCGLIAISLVDEPAVGSMVQHFETNPSQLKFNIENEDKRIVTGLIMACNRPIYRVSNGVEYYIRFNRQCLEIMAEKMLSEGVQNNFNFQHNSEDRINGMLCREIYFKDVERGISPKGFDDVEDGSLFGTFFVSDDETWNKIKSNEFGFSLEGIFDLVETPVETDVEDDIIEMLGKIIDKKRNRK